MKPSPLHAPEVTAAGSDSRNRSPGWPELSNGILDETIVVIEEVVADARQAKHLTPLILGLVVDSWVHLLRGDSVGAFAAAHEAVDVAQGPRG